MEQNDLWFSVAAFVASGASNNRVCIAPSMAVTTRRIPPAYKGNFDRQAVL